MPIGNPQTRFLLRGSLLLIGMLALWWFVLVSPMLFLLRVSEQVALRLRPDSDSSDRILREPSGDWTFRVPVKNAPPIRSIEFTVARSDIVVFTLSVPVFWAILFAGPVTKRAIRAGIWGTALVSAVEVLSLLVFVMIAARAATVQWHPIVDGFTRWKQAVGDYLVNNVIPYAAPVLIAVAVHPDLRAQILPWETGLQPRK